MGLVCPVPSEHRGTSWRIVAHRGASGTSGAVCAARQCMHWLRCRKRCPPCDSCPSCAHISMLAPPLSAPCPLLPTAVCLHMHRSWMPAPPLASHPRRVHAPRTVDRFGLWMACALHSGRGLRSVVAEPLRVLGGTELEVHLEVVLVALAWSTDLLVPGVASTLLLHPFRRQLQLAKLGVEL